MGRFSRCFIELYKIRRVKFLMRKAGVYQQCPTHPAPQINGAGLNEWCGAMSSGLQGSMWIWKFGSTAANAATTPSLPNLQTHKEPQEQY